MPQHDAFFDTLEMDLQLQQRVQDVGMSRVGDPDQLQVFIPPKSDGISVCGKRNITVNTVYKEALSQHNT